jgi:hypothetical protein
MILSAQRFTAAMLRLLKTAGSYQDIALAVSQICRVNCPFRGYGAQEVDHNDHHPEKNPYCIDRDSLHRHVRLHLARRNLGLQPSLAIYKRLRHWKRKILARRK